MSRPRQRSPVRITPACAGKTCRIQSEGSVWADHPRMRGEDDSFGDGRRRRLGSPPHARGRQLPTDWPGRWTWITPACAGKTVWARTSKRSTRDHPRMRGEDGGKAAASSYHPGSPPHARGRLDRMPSPARTRRITPACAGKTAPHAAESRLEPDHPRMRGEDLLQDRSLTYQAGSPPHARGRRCGRPPRSGFPGITPACAGKTRD